MMTKTKNWLYKKTIIVSGASGGIGFNVAKLLIENYDCKIIGIARNEDKIKKAIQSLGEKSKNFSYYLFDVSDKKNWENFANDLVEKDIIPDVLFNNAGFMLPFKRFDKLSDSEIDEIIKTNFSAYVYSVKTLFPLLKQSQTPSIINVSSAAGLCAVVGESMYCAVKYAVRGFTETLQQDYDKNEVFVCGIYPGFIKTNILHRMSVTDKNNKLIIKMMMPVEKAAQKMIKGISRRKKRIVMGADGKAMGFFSALFPKMCASMIKKVLKISKLELFDEVFDNNNEKRKGE